MVHITITYKNGDIIKHTASYTKIRGSFFCIHFDKNKDGKYPNMFIPSDEIKSIDQVSDSTTRDEKEG